MLSVAPVDRLQRRDGEQLRDRTLLRVCCPLHQESLEVSASRLAAQWVGAPDCMVA
jgi:hypothetical protein